ncbi:MAG: hypothetical protein RLZZ399_1577 [Verrucomicrobiota bacterium]
MPQIPRGAPQCLTVSLAIGLALLSGGCTGWMPNSGPSASSIRSSEGHSRADEIRVVALTPDVANQLSSRKTADLFSDKFREPSSAASVVGAGDSLEVSVMEAPPATLFSAAPMEGKASMGSSRLATLPEQVVNREGTIKIPFAGQVHAAGKSIQEIEDGISARLQDKANQPQVLVRQTRNTTAHATVVGEVTTSIRLPLTPAKERLLDAIAAAGGTKLPVNKMTIQVTRGKRVCSLPMETIIADPRQNITLMPGDVVTALSQPLSFTALGATGKNEEINFEAKGISLAQALARSGGLADSRSSSRGVFIFRMETPKDTPFLSAASGAPAKKSRRSVAQPSKIPVVYSVNLRDPASFFLAKNFQMSDGDILFVSNAPAAELQKFVNIVASVAYPVMSTVTTSAALSR